MEQSEDCAALSFAGLNFLLIDDDADGRDFVKTLLITHGARVTTFSTAAEARESLTLSTPDVIICDIGLPSEDGYEFMRRVRASESSVAAVPAVALTAYAGVEDQAKALTAGYQKHLAKPVEPNELLRALKILTRES
jgi:CheY-like chemotaxis protein